jgi:hypothetical protein
MHGIGERVREGEVESTGSLSWLSQDKLEAE